MAAAFENVIHILIKNTRLAYKKLCHASLLINKVKNFDQTNSAQISSYIRLKLPYFRIRILQILPSLQIVFLWGCRWRKFTVIRVLDKEGRSLLWMGVHQWAPDTWAQGPKCMKTPRHSILFNLLTFACFDEISRTCVLGCYVKCYG